MTEPPTKRARRVDSSTMWELNDRRTHSPTPTSEYDRSPRRESYAKDDGGRRDGPRDNRRYRSRSRDQRDRRRERSRSRDRRDRDRRDRDRDGRGAKDKDRNTSRDRHYERRGKAFFFKKKKFLIVVRFSIIAKVLQDTQPKVIDCVTVPARLFEKVPGTDPELRLLEDPG